MPKVLFSEKTRMAQRLFTLEDSKFELEIFGRIVGTKYSQVFRLEALSPESVSTVRLRYDAVFRGCFLALMFFVLGLQIAKLHFEYSFFAAWIVWIPGCMSLWAALKWVRRKEETETFRTLTGEVAFVIYNDSVGSTNFMNFIRLLKQAIQASSTGVRRGA